MNNSLKIFFSIGSLCILASCSSVDSSSNKSNSSPSLSEVAVDVEISKAEDIRYAPFDPGSANLLDIYRPDDGKVYPGVVLLHGGGWRTGDKEQLDETSEDLAKKGYVVANVNYRLSSTTKKSFPEAVIDVKAAIRWFRANAATYNVNPDKIGGVGGSAGGNLIAMAATTAHIDTFDGPPGNNDEVSDALQATIVLAGGIDQENRMRVTSRRAKGAETIRAYFGLFDVDSIDLDNPEHLKLVRDASPMTHASPKMGPLLLVESGQDFPNPPIGRYPPRTREKLKEFNPHSDYMMLTDAKHSKWNDDEYREIYVNTYDKFLRPHLK